MCAVREVRAASVSGAMKAPAASAEALRALVHARGRVLLVDVDEAWLGLEAAGHAQRVRGLDALPDGLFDLVALGALTPDPEPALAAAAARVVPAGVIAARVHLPQAGAEAIARRVLDAWRGGAPATHALEAICEAMLRLGCVSMRVHAAPGLRPEALVEGRLASR